MKERRRAPRIEASLKLELRLPGRQVATIGETLNISSNGIYFKTGYFMSEGTKLPIIIHLPASDELEATTVQPEGIVVRCIPEEEDPAVDVYEVACFFMEVEEEDAERQAQKERNPGGDCGGHKGEIRWRSPLAENEQEVDTCDTRSEGCLSKC